MNDIVDLGRMLAQANAQALDGLVFQDKTILDEVKRLEKWLGSASTEKPAKDVVREAVQRFHHSLVLPSLREARLVCFGCLERYGQNNECLLEDLQRFPILLKRTDEYRTEPRAFRRCYLGLLWAYFSYDQADATAVSAGKRNWETLRSYLHDRIQAIKAPGLQPEWVSAIVTHDNLLTPSPFDRYGLSLLEGSGRPFEEIKRKVDISDASWAFRSLLLTQIRGAISRNDVQFIGYIPRVISLITQHEFLLDDGLAMVLERYRQSAETPAHALLSDFAVHHWGNPWLLSNGVRWRRVTEPTRQMVANWLKLELIRQFFSLLAEDGANDKRRLKFWEKYHQNIDDMYFALGNHARTSRNPDFIELRKKMAGRVLELTAGGSPRNNAFIMSMGDYVAVEFGVTGNACFIFRRSRVPFDLTRPFVAGDGSALKHQSHVRRLLHVDTGAEKWEQQFGRSIHELLGIRPTGEPIVRRSSDTERHSGTSQSIRVPGPVAYSLSELKRFCSARRLTIWDFTQKKGNLWVVTSDSDKVVNGQLSAWGFAYKPGKGWWRERP